MLVDPVPDGGMVEGVEPATVGPDKPGRVQRQIRLNLLTNVQLRSWPLDGGI